MGRIAIVGGTGALPAALHRALVALGEEPVLAEVAGFPLEGLAGAAVEPLRLERLVPFLDRLAALGVDRVVLAGAVRRPRLEPGLFDPRTARLVPRILAAMPAGDDAALRVLIALIEEAGLAVVAAESVAPALLPSAGVLGRVEPGAGERRDAARAAAIVAALGAADVGQGAVVAGGLCLGTEALPGTDALLAQVAALPVPMGPSAGVRRGLLYKAPKPGQDCRVDRPALGPATVVGAAAAGLAGIAFEAGGVLVLDRAKAVAAADAAGLFLWARDPSGSS
ncbi:MAG: UDP-2,3-diacylglucosamine diphosphatase LpxI [Rhodobacteraceae bacterium]|nr:UDP-2,3-diacylglucosamine diphosphatase LpxI [Paracoccaceae bacterium]